jgi:hypothetical protein
MNAVKIADCYDRAIRHYFFEPVTLLNVLVAEYFHEFPF